MAEKSPKETQSQNVRPTYGDYLKYAAKFKLDSLLNKDQFNRLVEYGETGEGEFPSELLPKLGYVPPTPFPGYIIKPGPKMPVNPNPKNPLNPPGGGGKGPTIPDLSGFSDPVGTLFELYETLADPNAAPASKIKTIVGLVDKITKGGGGEGNIKPGKTPASSVAPSPSNLGINIKPNAIEVSYEPNIDNTLYSNYYRTNLDRDSNVYVTQCTLHLPQGDPDVRGYIENILIPDLQTRANVSVNFNVNAGNTFTYDKIITYMDKIMEAMSVYYSYSNILAYCSATSNNNTGMYKLREMISVQDIQNLYLLSERLNNIPIPPRLRELCYWISNIYKASNGDPNTPILFNTPLQLYGNETDVDGNGYGYQSYIGSVIPELITALNPPNSVGSSFDGNMINMLAKVCPGWLGTPMGSAPGIPLFDYNFLDYWANSPCQVVSADADQSDAKVPYVGNGSRSHPIEYVSFSDELSGMSQALFSTYIFGGVNLWSGLVVPTTSATRNFDGGLQEGSSNRFIFAKSGGLHDGEFYPYYGNRGTQHFNASNPYSQKGGDYPKSQGLWFNNPGPSDDTINYNYTYIPPTSQMLLGMNLSSNSMPALNATRWLMSFDEAFSRSSDKPARSRGRGRRGKRGDKETDTKE